MSDNIKVVVACRVSDLRDPLRPDAQKRPCAECGFDVWVESTSQRLIDSDHYGLLCVPCAKDKIDPETIDWHPQTSGRVALGHLPPALREFYDID